MAKKATTSKKQAKAGGKADAAKKPAQGNAGGTVDSDPVRALKAGRKIMRYVDGQGRAKGAVLLADRPADHMEEPIEAACAAGLVTWVWGGPDTGHGIKHELKLTLLGAQDNDIPW